KKKHVSLGRAREKPFQPADGLAPCVRERVDASDARPEHVASLCSITLAVQRRFDLATQDEIGLFVSVVVQADRDARQVLDEQQAMVARPEFLVNKPLQTDTLQAAGFDAPLVTGRNLSDIEVDR